MHRKAGRGQLLVEQLGVGVAQAVHDRDAVQRTPRLELRCDQAHGLAHFAGRVGRAHHVGHDRAIIHDLDRRPEVPIEMVDQRGGGDIRLELASDTDERPQPALDRKCVDQLELRGTEAMRKMQDDLPDISQIGLSRRDTLGRRSRDIALVVVVLRLRLESIDKGRQRRAPMAVMAKLVERIGTGSRELVEKLDHCCLSGVRGRHPLEWRRTIGEHLAHQRRARTASSNGLRPAAANAPAPNSSASRSSTMKRTLTMPPGRAPSSRRSARPVRLPGTTTVTGASGSPSLPAAMTSARVSVAARPNGTVVSRATPPRSMTQR